MVKRIIKATRLVIIKMEVEKMDFEQWNGFNKGEWKRQIDVRSFIQKNYTPYVGDSSFLTGTTEKTKKLWDEVLELYQKEHDAQGGVLDIDTKTI